MSHPVRWNIPSPLWDRTVSASRTRSRRASAFRFGQPELLRFDNDAFIDEVQEVLSRDPDAVADFMVRSENWRTSSDEWLQTPVPAVNDAVKLYQPVQQRFYLATASLVCRTSGLPDRSVKAQNEERVACVLRRIVPAGDREAADMDVTDEMTFSELGWCGPGGWMPVPATGVLTGEEEIPAFPLTYLVNGSLETFRSDAFRPRPYQGDGAPGPVAPTLSRRPRRMRTVWAAMVPVGRRDEFEISRVEGPATAPDVSGDDTFSEDIRWQTLRATGLLGLIQVQNNAEDTANDLRSSLRDAVVYAVLDILEVLQRSGFENLLTAMQGESASLAEEEQDIINHLDDADLENGQDWLWLFGRVLDNVNDAFQLQDAGIVLSATALSPEQLSDAVSNLGVKEGAAFRTLLKALLDSNPAGSDERPPEAPPVYEEIDGARYIVRFIYHRPNCPPYPARSVSHPSRQFSFASFYDPDGPVRPLRVALPANADPGTLRGAAKGVSFLFSKSLRQQMERMQEVTFTDLSDGEIDEGGGVSIGMICSLSIPIITICAMIVLFIIVSLLNIVFWWLPYFKICFPIPQASD